MRCAVSQNLQLNANVASVKLELNAQTKRNGRVKKTGKETNQKYSVREGNGRRKRSRDVEALLSSSVKAPASSVVFPLGNGFYHESWQSPISGGHFTRVSTGDAHPGR